MNPAETVRKILEAYRAGQWWTALTLSLRLAADLASVFPMNHPEMMRADAVKMSDEQLVEQIAKCECPEAADHKAMRAGSWVAVLLPLLLDLVRRLLNR